MIIKVKTLVICEFFYEYGDVYVMFNILSTKLNMYKINLVDPWVRQKLNQHILQNTVCNGRHEIDRQARRHKNVTK